MSDKFSFDYNDTKNDIRIKVTIDVTDLAKIKEGSKVKGMALFQSSTETWYKGKKYEPHEFMELAQTDDFKLEYDFGFGGLFNFFCASVGAHIHAMAVAGKDQGQPMDIM